MTRRRMTDADWKTVRSALNHAMDERDSLADAYSYQGEVAERAMADVRRFEALHVKLFGEASARAQDRERYAAMPTVSLLELAAGKGSKPNG